MKQNKRGACVCKTWVFQVFRQLRANYSRCKLEEPFLAPVCASAPGTQVAACSFVCSQPCSSANGLREGSECQIRPSRRHQTSCTSTVFWNSEPGLGCFISRPAAYCTRIINQMPRLCMKFCYSCVWRNGSMLSQPFQHDQEIPLLSVTCLSHSWMFKKKNLFFFSLNKYVVMLVKGLVIVVNFHTSIMMSLKHNSSCVKLLPTAKNSCLGHFFQAIATVKEKGIILFCVWQRLFNMLEYLV